MQLPAWCYTNIKKMQLFQVFELADGTYVVGDSVDRGGKKDIPCGIVVHL